MPRYSEYDDTLEKTMGMSGRGVASNQVNRRFEKAMLGVLNATSDSAWDVVYKAAALEEDSERGMASEDVGADLRSHEGRRRLERAKEAEEWQSLRDQIGGARNRVLKMQADAAAAADAEARNIQDAATADVGGLEDIGRVAKPSTALHRRKKKYADAVKDAGTSKHETDDTDGAEREPLPEKGELKLPPLS